ncbi:NADPH-dependent FMN reductase [Metabacillus fastidiosus]|uniref:NADPH-dependent FMN reductase n=1 Tax=Metabacillus fastidiosus TaxID=1458 RepID=UPI003D2D5B4B
MKVVAIVGSVRESSYSLKLAQYMQNKYQEKLNIEIVSIKELPFYNQDIENNPPSPVIQFVKKVSEADAVLWVTTEYNYSIPGVLKNAIDWLSRGNQSMVGKPSWIVGVSMGLMGSIRAQEHLRDILFSPGISSRLLPGNEVYIGLVHEKIDTSGNLIHEPTVKFLDVVVDNFIAWFKQEA